MHCLRCQGLMRAESFEDWATNNAFIGWRCLSCGNVWDPRIADNRIHAGTGVKTHRPRCAALSVAIPIRSKSVGQQSRIGK